MSIKVEKYYELTIKDEPKRLTEQEIHELYAVLHKFLGKWKPPRYVPPISVSQKLRDASLRTLEEAGKEMIAREVAEKIGYNYRSVSVALKILREEGKIDCRRGKKGALFYFLLPKPEENVVVVSEEEKNILKNVGESLKGEVRQRSPKEW